MMENYLNKFEESNPEKRDKLVKKISESVDTTVSFLCLNFCAYTTVLPILQKWPKESQGLVERALVDQDMKSDLEEGKLINWCRTAQLIYSLKTTRDGNCLLHSISMYIWGIEDQSLFLRRLLFCALQTDEHEVFKKRYFQYMADRNADLFGNLLQFDSVDKVSEWKSIVDNVEPKHNPNFATPLPFLEPIHIYVMANILKRPIIVMADPRIRTTEAVSIQDNDIVGIYLPLDVQPGLCYKYPIVLGFNFNHFTPLVSTKEDPKIPRKLAIPLQKHDLSMMPLRFLYPAEEKQIGNLMASYLHLVDLVHSEPLCAAKLGDNPLPGDMNLIPEYFQDCERKHRRFLNGDSQSVFVNEQASRNVGEEQKNPPQNTRQPINASPSTMSHFQTVQCVTAGCKMYGSAATGNMCSTCLSKYTMENTGPPLSLFFNQLDPSAPPATPPLNADSNMTSMVQHQCHTPGCNFFCSIRTYPLCYECKEKQKQAQKLSVNVNRQASNQSEEMIKLSAKLDTNVQTGMNFIPQTQNTSKSTSDMNTELSESDLFGPGNGCRGEIEVTSENGFNSQTHLVSNMRKEAEVIPNGNFQRRKSGTPTKTTCSNYGCNGSSISSNNLCSLCFMRTGIPGLLPTINQNPPTQQSTSQKSPTRQNALTKQSTNQNTPFQQLTNPHEAWGIKNQPNITLGVTRFSSKHICSKPGCEGIRQENKFGMCSSCFDSVSPEKMTEPTQIKPSTRGIQELDLNRQCSIEDNLEVSATPSGAMIEPRQVSCMDDDSTECASPLCDTRVYPPNKLCQNCLDVLRQHQPSPRKQQKQSKKTTCKNKGCEFHGAPEFDEFCSRCYKNVSAGNLYVVTNNNSAPISRQNKFPVETPQPRSNSAPISRKGAKCQVEGCTYFGDPKFSNLCTTCFQILKPNLAEGVGNSNFPVQEASLSQGASNFVSNVNSFDRRAQALEQSRREQTICRRHGCKNHGNTNCEGFCNDCFRKYYQTIGRTNSFS